MAKTPSRPLDEVIGHRSEIIAQVVLTRLLEVNPIKVDVGDVDFFAFIDKEGDPERFRFFAVIVKGAANIPSAEAADDLNLEMQKQLTDKVYLFPTIVLVCSMENERVFYAWQMEPYLDGGEPKLKKHRKLSFSEFTVDALRETVDRTNEWYDPFVQEFAESK